MSAQEIILNGRYRLITQHGSGGMSVVYKAQDLRLGRTVAVKILRPSLTTDPSFLQRFQQEARNVANLAHPNIVTLHDFGQDGNNYYMVMEFIDGQDLKKVIRASAPFSIERALHIGIQICAGIGYAHRAGLVHADVKPQNILLTGNDTVKVTDFGIAQALSVAQNMERQSVVWGSPHYFAPEQATGEPPNTASDVYAIGIVTFEMLTGRLPYSGADQQELAMAHIREQVPHVTDFNPNVPIHLDRIVYKVMSKEPSQRYRMADQLGRILIDYQKRGQDFTSNVAPASPSQSPSAAPIAAAAQPMPLRPTGNTPPPQPAQQPLAQRNDQGGGYGGSSVSQQTPPPQQPYAQPPPGAEMQRPVASGVNFSPTPSSSNVPGAYPPQQGQGNPNYLSESSGYRPVAPAYAAPPRSGSLDTVSVFLAIIAFIAVIGLLLLWLAVLGAYR